MADVRIMVLRDLKKEMIKQDAKRFKNKEEKKDDEKDIKNKEDKPSLLLRLARLEET